MATVPTVSLAPKACSLSLKESNTLAERGGHLFGCKAALQLPLVVGTIDARLQVPRRWNQGCCVLHVTLFCVACSSPTQGVPNNRWAAIVAASSALCRLECLCHGIYILVGGLHSTDHMTSTMPYRGLINHSSKVSAAGRVPFNQGRISSG